MRILIVNKFYYLRGGDCVCTISLEQMLRAAGHETAVFAMQYPENLPTPFSRYFAPCVDFAGGISCKLKAASRIFGGAGVRPAFAQILQDFRPDVVHFNNIHSYLSPAIVKMAKEAGAKTVWTLHDYKLVCPAYACLCNGTVCEDCIAGSKMPVVKKRCMKGSRTASLLAYLEALYWNRQKLEEMTDAFVCPSRFMASKMEAGGFNARKLKTVCNFVDPAKVQSIDIRSERLPYYAYVGRLSKEKGIETLLSAASRLPLTLKVAGGGPLEKDMREKFAGCSHIEFLGHLNAPQVKQVLSDAKFSVITSEWYENNPLSVIESLCMGTPVVGARTGGIPELIRPENGFLFRSGDPDSLRKSIESAWEQPFNYAEISRTAMNKFSKERYLEEIMTIYKSC